MTKLTFWGALLWTLNANSVFHIIYACVHFPHRHVCGDKALFHNIHIFFQCFQNWTKLLLNLLSLVDCFGKSLYSGTILSDLSPQVVPLRPPSPTSPTLLARWIARTEWNEQGEEKKAGNNPASSHHPSLAAEELLTPNSVLLFNIRFLHGSSREELLTTLYGSYTVQYMSSRGNPHFALIRPRFLLQFFDGIRWHKIWSSRQTVEDLVVHPYIGDIPA